MKNGKRRVPFLPERRIKPLSQDLCTFEGFSRKMHRNKRKKRMLPAPGLS